VAGLIVIGSIIEPANERAPTPAHTAEREATREWLGAGRIDRVFEIGDIESIDAPTETQKARSVLAVLERRAFMDEKSSRVSS
jgi:hypothetical protein